MVYTYVTGGMGVVYTGHWRDGCGLHRSLEGWVWSTLVTAGMGVVYTGQCRDGCGLHMKQNYWGGEVGVGDFLSNWSCV